MRPSSAVKLMVVATLRPSTSAHMLAPLPRWATTVRPAAARGSVLREQRGDVLVGQSVKAVAADALLGVAAGQSERLRHGRLRAVKGGIEARDLRQRGRAFRDGPDRRQVVGLVQRRQRNERFELGERRGVDENRAREARAAMDDTMPDGHDAMLAEHAASAPAEEVVDRALVSELRPGRPFLLRDHVAGRAGDEARPGRQPLELAPQEEPRRILIEEDGELQARRARIQHEQRVGHVVVASNVHAEDHPGQVQSVISGRSLPCSCA